MRVLMLIRICIFIEKNVLIKLTKLNKNDILMRLHKISDYDNLSSSKYNIVLVKLF